MALSHYLLRLQLLDAGIDQTDEVLQGAVNSPTIVYSGAVIAEHLAAELLERRQLREVLDVRSSDRVRRASRPSPRAHASRAAPSAFATATRSPSVSRNAIALGPSRSASTVGALPRRRGGSACS